MQKIKKSTGFNHIQQFEIFGEESINVIEHSKKLAEGQYVNINFYIKSREYNGRFYNTLMIKEISIKNSSTIEDIAQELSEQKMPFENNPPF